MSRLQQQLLLQQLGSLPQSFERGLAMARQRAMDAQVAQYRQQLLAMQQGRLALGNRAQDLREFQVPEELRLRGTMAQNNANRLAFDQEKFKDETGAGRDFKIRQSIAGAGKDPASRAGIFAGEDPDLVQKDMDARALKNSNQKIGQGSKLRNDAILNRKTKERELGLGASAYNDEAHYKEAQRRAANAEFMANIRALLSNNADENTAGAIQQAMDKYRAGLEATHGAQVQAPVQAPAPVAQPTLHSRVAELIHQGLDPDAAYDQAIKEGLR